MQLGMIGLGRMGANLVKRLQKAGHDCVVYDVDPAAVRRLRRSGATATRSLDELAARLEAPRAAWIMVPAGYAGATVEALAERFSPGDIIIDGGNSNWKDDVVRAAALAERGIHHLDVGTSGGIHGLERGYCLMIGGDDGAVRRLDPIFAALAPGVDAAERTPSRRAARGRPGTAEAGYLHCGPPGAGHFVKMVHNGIEYGLMAAYAEGLGVLAHANAGAEADGRHDAETAPLREPQFYRYDFDLAAIAEVWRRGSVVASWLLDLTANALAADPALEGFAGRVSDSGEGRWTVEAAIETGAPVHVLSAALFDRFNSRGEADVANRVLSALRQQFGGHQERP
ncbi:MAG: decarboxylating 6-phosphogluconate dehydrogenase [Acidimicrobiales bacterium]|nr:decarboxylating 6-phosphogluconate dehydrogenase [Acidimicrobiales bacterium]